MRMNKIIIGAMRFTDRQNTAEIIRKAIDLGFNYIDTAPCYCRKDELENSESWVGDAINFQDYRDRVMISAKCSPGNGGRGLGEFKPETGFGVRTVSQVKQLFEQSQRRLKVSGFDYYHLWTTHTREQFDDAMKPGGWYDGVQQLRHQWNHLGVTTHAGPETIFYFLETGKFESVTIPLNVINTTRMSVLDYCNDKGIKVIAMNPLAGGFMAANEELKELALRFLMTLENVNILIGFSAPEEVEYAKWIVDTMGGYKLDTNGILQRVSELLNSEKPHCTACGYCQPCPESINVGAALSYYNVYKYMGLESARKAFNSKQWEAGLKLEKCSDCGLCEKRCPNALPVREIIADAKKLLYETTGN